MPLSRFLKWLLSVVVTAGLMTGIYAGQATASTGEGGSFVPLTPALIADTRSGLGLPSTGTVPAGAERTIQVSGRGGVPTSGVSAVVLDFSAESNVNTAISAYPAGTTRNLGILSVSGQEERAANTAIIRLGTGGKIVVHNAKGNTDFNVGVQGYFTTESDADSTGGFVPITPERMVRSDTGTGMPAGRLQGGVQYTVQLAGLGEIPDDATAVFANVRIRNPSGSGAGRGGLRIGPSNTTISMSNTSVLDYSAGIDVDSGLAIKLGPDGKAKLLITTNTTADILIDVQGYFTASAEGGSFTPQDNRRIWDSRNSAGGALKPGEERTIRIAGTTGIPYGDAAAVSMGVTALDWTGDGWLAVYNPDLGRNGTSNLAFAGPYDVNRQTTAIVGVSEAGTITIRNGSSRASTHVLLNTQGWFSVPGEVEGAASEADRVSEAMRVAVETEAVVDSEYDEGPPAAIAGYDAHPLFFDPAGGERSVVLPVPSGCSIHDAASQTLQCDYGRVILSGAAVSGDGESVEVVTELTPDGLRIEPQGPYFDGFVTGYVTLRSGEELAETALETFEGYVATDDGSSFRSEAELDAEEQELNEESVGDGAVSSNDPNAHTVSPAAYTLAATNGTIRRPAYVGVPSNYRYCPNTCRPKTLHDYCSWSPNQNSFVTGISGRPPRYKFATVNFRGPCARHDMAIGTISKWNASRTTKINARKTQDKIFRGNIRQNCGNKFWDRPSPRNSCYNAAAVYYSAVSARTNTWKP